MNKEKFSLLVLGGSQGAEVFGKIVPMVVKMIKDTGFKLCTNHTKIKLYKDKQLKNIPKLDNPMLELGKQIIKTLDGKANFLEVDIVCIENQPALKNPTMKSVQMIL